MAHRSSRATLAAAILAAGLSPAAGADTLTLAPLRDATLYESATGALANGSGDHLFAGRIATGARRRALLFFDLAGQLPAGATIQSVALQLQLTRTNSGSLPSSLHRVLASWAEGPTDPGGEEGEGAAAQDGDVTWTHRLRPSSAWATPG